MQEVSIPYQYKNDNFIIIICNNYELLKNIEEYVKLREDNFNLVRYLKPNDDKYIDFFSSSLTEQNVDSENKEYKLNIYEEFFDELNEEEYIKKCKYIINLEDYKLKDSIEELIEKYKKNVYFIKNEWILEEYEKIKEEDFESNKVRRLRYINIKMNEEDNNIISLNNEKNRFSIYKEIDNKINNKENNIINNKINLITYIRKIENNDSIYSLQFKCVLENYKNPSIKNIVVIGNGVEDFFKNINYEKIENKKIILVNDDDDNISFNDMFLIANELFKEQVVVIIRSDIILLPNIELESMYLEYYIENKKIYCLTRIERDLTGRFIRMAPNQNLFGSIEQDGWMFKSPIKLNDNNQNIKLIKDYDFYEKWSELYLNKYLDSEGYDLVNDNRIHKIIRITTHQDLRVREYIKKESQKINKDDLMFLPEKGLIEKMTMEQWCNFCQIDENELYKWKIEMMNKSLKNKINMF